MCKKTRPQKLRARFFNVSCQPDERAHTSGHTIAAIGEKLVFLVESTEVATVDARDAERIQALTCQQINIGVELLPTTDKTTSHLTRLSNYDSRVRDGGDEDGTAAESIRQGTEQRRTQWAHHHADAEGGEAHQQCGGRILRREEQHTEISRQ